MEQFKKQIDNEMKGCGELFNNAENEYDPCGLYELCPTCKTRIKTYLTTMIKCYEEEASFLSSMNRWSKRFKQPIYRPSENRIEELKQNINYLKEKLEEVKDEFK